MQLILQFKREWCILMNDLSAYFDKNQLHPDEVTMEDKNKTPYYSEEEVRRKEDLRNIPYHYEARIRGGATTTIQAVMKEIEKVWAKRYAKDDTRAIEILPSHTVLGEYDGETVITYRKLLVEPTPEHKNLQPTYRQMFAHPDRMDEFVRISGQYLNYFMVFDVMGKSGQRVEETSEQLWDFLYQYRSHFKRNGVQEIRFVRMDEEYTETAKRGVINTIPMVFLIVIEKIFCENVSSIEGLTVGAEIKPAFR